ncbi:MAG: methyltransferase domain-containing protein [Candidatus Lokiarchaeota archaeon]|nr:methyltransferase domain-containing protein [Candidatus Lokiarchaeota archaeon]
MSLEKYKEDFLKDIDFIDKTIKKLNLQHDSKIIDVGTGIGAMAILLALNNFNVLTGEPKIDIETDHSHHHDHSLKMDLDNDVDHEDHHLSTTGETWKPWENWDVSAKKLNVLDRIKYQHFNVEKLPFANKFFNGIFMYDTLQHVRNRDLALKECQRVLAPDGVIFVVEWSRETIEYENRVYGYGIEYVDPSNYIKSSDVSIETINGKFVIIYLIQKI